MNGIYQKKIVERKRSKHKYYSCSKNLLKYFVCEDRTTDDEDIEAVHCSVADCGSVPHNGRLAKKKQIIQTCQYIVIPIKFDKKNTTRSQK